MSLFKRGSIWWYEFWFAGRRIQESSKSPSKTVAKQAEQQRRRELESGFNSVEDDRRKNVRTMRDQAAAYLGSYGLRNRSKTFAEYAIGHLIEFLGSRMLIDIDDASIREYQDARLKENAAPKTINEEVGFLLRLLEERGELIRAQLKRRKCLKLKVRRRESLHARGKGGLGCGGTAIEIPAHLSRVDAGSKHGHAQHRDPNTAMETDRSRQEILDCWS